MMGSSLTLVLQSCLLWYMFLLQHHRYTRLDNNVLHHYSRQLLEQDNNHIRLKTTCNRSCHLGTVIDQHKQQYLL